MRVRNVWACALGVTLAVTMACGGGSEPAGGGSAAPAATGTKVDAATAGNVTGSVVVEGAVPKNAPIKMNADPNCLTAAPGAQLQETYVVGGDGKSLGNVFVYVKDGLGNFVFDQPTDVVKITQEGCRYRPHVLGVRVGQEIEINNGDATLHNIHAMPKDNPEFNTAQPLKDMKTMQKFDKKEVMVPLKCEVHGWMNAYVGVLDHPYYAVTTDTGKFELKGLPPGTYTVEAWHEKLGTQTQSVTIAASETKDVTLTFAAPPASN